MIHAQGQVDAVFGSARTRRFFVRTACESPPQYKSCRFSGIFTEQQPFARRPCCQGLISFMQLSPSVFLALHGPLCQYDFSLLADSQYGFCPGRPGSLLADNKLSTAASGLAVSSKLLFCLAQTGDPILTLMMATGSGPSRISLPDRLSRCPLAFSQHSR